MSWDLALADNGDVIISPSKDLSGKSGIDLLNQRIVFRLKLHRGEWVYDEDGSFGSQLYQLMGYSPDKAKNFAAAYAREALRDLSNEIAVDDVQVQQNTRSVTVMVNYHVLEETGIEATPVSESVNVEIPLGGL